MKKALVATILALLALAPAAVARPGSEIKKGDAVTEEADRLTAELKDTLQKMSSVEDTAKALEQEDRRLKDTDDLLKGAAANLHKQMTELQMRGSAWDQKRQQHLDSGCPAEGGSSTDDALVERCNRETSQLNPERDQILDRAQTLKEMATGLAQRRQDLTDGTVAWAQKKKANDAAREDLTQARIRIEARLLELQKQAGSCQRLLKGRGVSCERLKHLCGNIQFDGSDPNLPPSKVDSPCGKR